MISVIIPTYNGGQKILNCLKSLDTQTFTDFEVIVVIDGSSDDTKQLIKQTEFSILRKEIPLRVHYQKNSGRASTRNKGASLANGELLLFVDDDIRLLPNVLEKHLKHYRNIPNSILIGSAVEDKKLIESDFQKFRAHLSNKWLKNINCLYPKPLPKHITFLMAAHFSIPKNIFTKVGGFFEGLIDAEDYEMATRLKKNNYAIYFNSNIIGWHDDFISCASYIKRQKQYVKAHKILKTQFGIENEALSRKRNIFKKSIYSFFSYPIWLFFIDHFNWLLIFPKKVRYFIYDLVITGNIGSS